MRGIRHQRHDGNGLLGRAIDAQRRARGGERGLSPQARDRILGRVAAPGRPPRLFPALFTPWSRLVSAGVLPILVTATLLILVGSPAEQGRAVAVKAAKSGDFVVFTIANGDRTHYVTKSTRPDRFDPGSAVPVRSGEYLDRTDSRDALVFYKID